MALTATADRAVRAYGGADLWNAAEAVEARVNVSGFLFRMKTNMPPPEIAFRVDAHRPWTRLDPINKRGDVGILDGRDVRLETPGGDVIRSRQDARSRFPLGGRIVHWDDLDLAYFLGYAAWNYFTLPALLLRDDIVWAEVADGTLASTFPPELPTHGQEQQHVFDVETGLLEAYDYTAEVVLPIAYARHVIKERESADGVPYESRRIVYPSLELGRKVLPRPIMVDVKIPEWRLIPGS
jgi:hypothetical protein